MSEITIKKLGEILLEQGIISPQQLSEAIEEQKLTGQKLGEVLINKGWLSQADIERCLGIQGGITRFDLSNYIIEPAALKLIPEDFARKYKLIPVFLIENTLTVAMSDPANVFVIDELQRMSRLNVEAVLANDLDIKKAQDQYYGGSDSLREIIASIDKTKLSESQNLGEEAPIIKIVSHLITLAVQSSASDIHIEPEEKSLTVRYRIEGLLHRKSSLPQDLGPAVISRVKILAGLDIAEKRLPQDGRIMLKMGGRDVDFRVSTCPTVHGENVVLRILDKSGLRLDLESLGFLPRDMLLFKELIHAPYGIILVTGPTGSGKTTTLYSALSLLNKENVNIMTVEDPVEYQFPGLRQVQVNAKAGLNFAHSLRSFLRQDPDIIMVGEIRDRETAECAIQAALTGHLVFSTLHTNSASAAFSRLMDMGVEPFLISSSLLGVLAQRLIRKVCAKCKETYHPDEEMLKNLGLEDKIGQPLTFSRGRGCQLCNKSGYKGRIGIYELLKVTPALRRMVLKKSSSGDIADMAVKEGMLGLRRAGLDYLLAGITTPEEVVRVTMESTE